VSVLTTKVDDGDRVVRQVGSRGEGYSVRPFGRCMRDAPNLVVS
jgi:hypothetical protein